MMVRDKLHVNRLGSLCEHKHASKLQQQLSNAAITQHTGIQCVQPITVSLQTPDIWHAKKSVTRGYA